MSFRPIDGREGRLQFLQREQRLTLWFHLVRAHHIYIHPALEVQRALDGVWEFTTIIKIATVEVIGCTIISMKNDFKTIYGYGVEKTDFTFQ